MSLRDDIASTLKALGSPSIDEAASAIAQMPVIAALDNSSAATLLPDPMMTAPLGQPSGIEQGVTRLRLSAFLTGKPGPWNGGGDNPWVRYRGHQINREDTADGYVASTAYLDHQGETRTAGWTVGRYPLSSIKMIDELLDVVIEHHGVPGDEIVDAEVVELITGDTARRVLDSWRKWNRRNTENLSEYDPAFAADQFAAAIDRDEVHP